MTIGEEGKLETKAASVRPLHLHTIDSLFVDLINGNYVEAVTKAGKFQLKSAESRSILNWYRQQTDKWSTNMSEAIAQAIGSCVEIKPPTLPAIAAATSTQKKRLWLQKMQVHRFGGIHAYGTSTQPPEDFILVPSKGISLFEGGNGSGKTSILNAIVWCLNELEMHFVAAKALALKDVKLILGNTFDPDNEDLRNDLTKNISLARAELPRIGQLPSAVRLGALNKLTEVEKTQAKALIDQIIDESKTMVALILEPAVTQRKQLYARVTSWMQIHSVTDISNCQVCNRPLLLLEDPITGKLIITHLEEAQIDNPELLSQTVQIWAEHRQSMLAEKLPEALRQERERDLPQQPSDLIMDAICTELFAAAPFAGTLLALKDQTLKGCSVALKKLPPFQENFKIQLGLGSNKAVVALETTLQRISRALEFSSWRLKAKDEVRLLFSEVVGKSEKLNETSGTKLTMQSSLAEKLDALQVMVDGSAPIDAAILLTKRMTQALEIRRKNEAQIRNYRKAAVALAEIQELGQLADLQISSLQKTLDYSAQSWRSAIYHDPNSSSHKLKRTDMTAGGILNFHVGSDIITAPAQHISNASALQASLIGFFLAFRSHVLKNHGGLELLILDDPQELLDEHNRSKMSNALVKLASNSAQLFVTTYDKRFAQMTVEEGIAQDIVKHFSIHPVNAKRNCVEIADSKKEIDTKRVIFETHLDDHVAAKDYANSTRMYLETRLRDLFDDPAYPAYASNASKPGFGDHLNYLRALVANPPNALFGNYLIKNFASKPALTVTHECHRVLSDSHHNPEKISYSRVTAISPLLKDLCKSVDLMHQAFRDWRWQNKLPSGAGNDDLPALKTINSVAFEYAVYPDLAAFIGGEITVESQEAILGTFSSKWFSDKAFFVIRSTNLGFAIPRGAVAIIEANSSEGRDRNLVIARKKGEVLARRLFREKDKSGYSLAAVTPDPRVSPPTLFVESDEYAIHRIVGCLLTEVVPPQSSNEAVQIQMDSITSTIQAVYKLDKESAVPFALPNQLLLGGEVILPADYAKHEGKIAAITLDSGANVLKRIGSLASPSLSYVRHFETIGGLGESLMLQIEDVEDSPFKFPVIAFARLAVGVIYEI